MTTRHNGDWRQPGHSAVITGGASGIGLAAAKALRRAGMNVLIADSDREATDQARAVLAEVEGSGRSLDAVCDVADASQVEALRDLAFDELGTVHCLMNNAGTGFRVGKSWENLEDCRKTVEINLWGIVHGCHAFLPRMLASDEPAVVINTGSKQGITKPPGNYAYNLSKAGVLAYTEGLAHDLDTREECSVRAHLLIPGFTYTGMVARHLPEKPPAAWTPEQVVEYLLERVDAGDFYVLCPDNDTSRELDEKRMQWNADDLIKNRPALSRWHPDWAGAFQRYVEGE